MGHQRLGYYLMVIMLLLPSLCYANPVPKGGKMAFGAGLMGGILAGAAISKALPQNTPQNPQEHHVYHHLGESPTSTQQSQIHSPTIENGPLLANGCYEQTLHEPNLQNPAQFTKTVRLICPSSVPAAGVPQQIMPQMPQQSFPVTPQAYPQQNPPAIAQPYPQQNPQLASVADPQPNPPIASQLFPPQNPPQGVPAQNPPATAQIVPQPNLPQVVPQQPPAQVYVISSKTGYYKNSTKSNAINMFLLLISIIFVFLSKSI